MTRRYEGLTLAAVGQALIKRDLRQYATEAYRDVIATIQAADVRFTNFEGTITGRYGGWPAKDDSCIAPEPVVLDTLQAIGFNVVSLANNHAIDLGPGGILSALEEAERRGFLHAGTGVDFTDASRPRCKDLGKGTVALHAMDCSRLPDNVYALDATERVPARPGLNPQRTVLVGDKRAVNPADAERNVAAIAEAARQADFVIAYLHNHHWEENIEDTPVWLQDFARRCIDAGADAFITHGVPLLQGVEVYKHRPIFYGLGNFIFHSHNVKRWAERTNGRAYDSVIATCTFGGDNALLGMELVPITAGGDTAAVLNGTPFTHLDAPRIERAAKGTEILERIARLSRPFGTHLHIEHGRGRLVLA